jgi:hypothetical protein
VCAPTIVYAGLNRTLTLQREEGSNTVQCKCVLGLLPPRNALIYPFSAATTPPPFQDSRLAASTEYIFCVIYRNVVLNDLQNVDGVVIFTNTGPTLTSLPGACPATITRVTKTVC